MSGKSALNRGHTEGLKTEAAAQLNSSGCSTSPAHTTGNRCLIALIVYLALLLDNVLLTVIVPILPDYLANLDMEQQQRQDQPHRLSPMLISLDTNGASKPPLIYRHGEHYVAKHPIPGKSMVNFTPLQLPSNEATTTTPTNTAMPMPVPMPTVLMGSIENQSGGSNVSKGLAKSVDNRNDNSNSNNNNNGNGNINSNNTLALTQENGSIGLLLAMKALVQLIFNPIVGNASNKFGYRLPIVVGTFFLLVSSLVFTVGESYWSLLLARAVQGVGSACVNICGMSLVAQHYPEDDRRSKVMGIILGSIALGVLLGYPFGGILYDLAGKPAPFIILSAFIFLNLGLQLFTMDLTVQPEVELELEQKAPKWRPLLECKMILAIVVAIWFSTSTMAILEPCLPIWLIQYLKPNKWQLGTVFIPDSLGYFVGTNFFGTIAYRFGQVKVSCISLILVGIASILIPSATTLAQLLLPHFALGLGIGIIDAALVPLLASFVDATLSKEEASNDSSKTISSYGTVYAIQQTSVSLAYCLAPLIGGELAQNFGFAWLMRIVGIFNLAYGPMLVYLYHKYDPKTQRDHNQDILLQTSGRGSRYNQFYNSMDME
ncbi:synaptic vesicular amine transporter [Drosophila tropicalis]|uniref:synaptic vesicular amine transporter n=1 Tax=Drosophila tropicalis TaxID=46794 RepID=UPI0035ABE033